MNRLLRFCAVFGAFACMAFGFADRAWARIDVMPGTELHAAYCLAFYDHNLQERQDQEAKARATADQLTVAGKMRPLSTREKSTLDSASTAYRHASDSIRHWAKASERMKSFLMSRGYVSEGHVVLPQPDMSVQAEMDLTICNSEKDKNSDIFVKCSADCQGNGACYLGCVDKNASKSCRGIWSCSGNDFLPF